MTSVAFDLTALPIAGYDRLRASDILPRLAELTAGQLAVVRRHELLHKRRATLLARIDALQVEVGYAAHDPKFWRTLLVSGDEDAPAEVVDLTVAERPRRGLAALLGRGGRHRGGI